MTTATAEFMAITRRDWVAFGEHDPAERTAVLDLFGFDLQFVFPTASFPQVLMSDPSVFVEAT